jgi:hypothetical protein
MVVETVSLGDPVASHTSEKAPVLVGMTVKAPIDSGTGL